MQRMPLFSSFDHLEGIRKRGQKSTDVMMNFKVMKKIEIYYYMFELKSGKENQLKLY